MYSGLSNGYSLDYPNSNERSDINWKKYVDMNLYKIININHTNHTSSVENLKTSKLTKLKVGLVENVLQQLSEYLLIEFLL